MNSFDWKSGLIGLLLALSIFIGVGGANQKKGEDQPSKPEALAVGRFQIVANASPGTVTIMVLDTGTGQVWYDDHLPNNKPAEAFLAPKIKAKK